MTGIRRSGKSKLLSAFARYIRSIDSTSNVIEIDLTKLRFEKLKDHFPFITKNQNKIPQKTKMKHHKKLKQNPAKN